MLDIKTVEEADGTEFDLVRRQLQIAITRKANLQVGRMGESFALSAILQSERFTTLFIHQRSLNFSYAPRSSPRHRYPAQ